MWWEGDIPTPSSGGNEGKTAPIWLLVVVILFCLGLGVGLMLIGRDLFGDQLTSTPTPSESAP